MQFIIHLTPRWGGFIRRGAIMAGADVFHVDIKGTGGHGAYPHQSADPVMTAVSLHRPFKLLFLAMLIRLKWW